LAHSKRSKLNPLHDKPTKLYSDAHSVSNATSTTVESTAASSNSGPVLPNLQDHIPCTAAIINLSHGTSRPLVVLLDSGSGLTWGHPSILPTSKGCNPKTAEKLSGDTLAGTFCSNQEVTAESMTLPKFFKQQALSDVIITNSLTYTLLYLTPNNSNDRASKGPFTDSSTEFCTHWLWHSLGVSRLRRAHNESHNKKNNFEYAV